MIVPLEILNPKRALDSGQVFRYTEEEEGFLIRTGKRQLLLQKQDTGYLLPDEDREEFLFWKDYLDLDADYEIYHSSWKDDPLLEQAMEYGRGIRIFNQDPFETVISFIISANSHIPRIKSSIEKICRLRGEFVPGKYPYYTFPEPDALAEASIRELREEAKVGYRDKYIAETSRMIADGEFSLEDCKRMSTEDLNRELQRLPGVGPKVAQCIMLFGFGRMEAFPVDVWVKRILKEHYKLKKVPKDPVEFGKRVIGEGAGLAQQYYFYFIRSKGGKM